MSTPQRLGRYAVSRRIGSGGFATVWLGYDDQLDSPVAIKVLADNWSHDPAVRRRFVEEGRFLRRVDSPYVVGVHDAGELEDGRPFLVMTFADQGTLAERVEDGPLAVEHALTVIDQIGQGLAALHRRDVLHRDVKPGNVLFRSDGDGVRAMLGDLGLGKALDVSSRLTMIAGTPSYVAPEQARGEVLDARADLFSLGALTHLVLTGRPPFEHATLAAAATGSTPPRLGEVAGDWPESIEETVAQALAADREDRQADIPTFLAALREAAADLDTDAGPSAGAVSSQALVHPERTQIGARPSPAPAMPTATGAPLPEPTSAPEPPHRLRWAVAGVAAAVLAAGATYLGLRTDDRWVGVTDAQGTVSVSVPASWRDEVATDGWTPPDQDAEFAALSVSNGEEGLFAGVMPGAALPEDLPGHAECLAESEPVTDRFGGDPTRTVVHTDCPGVIAERVVRLSANRWLWVQVRAEDRATVNKVLDAVVTHGV